MIGEDVLQVGVSLMATSIKSYGVAAKWSAEAVRSRGLSTATASENANAIFFGASSSGTDWGAAFTVANSTDAAMQDYVKRNVDKFSGKTLEAMLTSTDLVDWYKAKKQKEMKEAADSIQKTMDALQTTPDFSSRTRSYLQDVDAAASLAQSLADAAAATAQDAANKVAEAKMAAMKAGSTVDVTV